MKGKVLALVKKRGIFRYMVWKCPLCNEINDDGLISPMKRKFDPDVGPDAIMVMVSADLDFLAKIVKIKEVKKIKSEADKGEEG